MFGVKTRPLSASLTPFLLLFLVTLASCGVGHSVGRGDLEQMQIRALSAEASATLSLEREAYAIVDAATLRHELDDAGVIITERNAEIDLLQANLTALSKATQTPQTATVVVMAPTPARTGAPASRR